MLLEAIRGGVPVFMICFEAIGFSHMDFFFETHRADGCIVWGF